MKSHYIHQLHVCRVSIFLPKKSRPEAQTVASWVPCLPSGAWTSLEHLIYPGPSLPEEAIVNLRAGSPSKNQLRPRLGFQVELERYQVLSVWSHLILTTTNSLPVLKLRNLKLREVNWFILHYTAKTPQLSPHPIHPPHPTSPRAGNEKVSGHYVIWTVFAVLTIPW